LSKKLQSLRWDAPPQLRDVALKVGPDEGLPPLQADGVIVREFSPAIIKR
jgi:hypothetical protein